ncbi:hypothetical protein EJP617_07200 [Erwinia sp. Ejp617]|nr:hypothetical protein EJP617_07200 [Erwinia sp. Ejp617]
MRRIPELFQLSRIIHYFLCGWLRLMNTETPFMYKILIGHFPGYFPLERVNEEE